MRDRHEAKHLRRSKVCSRETIRQWGDEWKDAEAPAKETTNERHDKTLDRKEKWVNAEKMSLHRVLPILRFTYCIFTLTYFLQKLHYLHFYTALLTAFLHCIFTYCIFSYVLLTAFLLTAFFSIFFLFELSSVQTHAFWF